MKRTALAHNYCLCVRPHRRESDENMALLILHNRAKKAKQMAAHASGDSTNNIYPMQELASSRNLMGPGIWLSKVSVGPYSRVFEFHSFVD